MELTMSGKKKNIWLKNISKIMLVLVTAISLMAAVYTLLDRFVESDSNRRIKLIFTDKNNVPYKHARVCLTGQDVDLSTTSDGDMSFNIKSDVKVLQGIIYYPHPVQFEVKLTDGVDQYILSI